MSLSRLTRKFASPTTNQPFPPSLQRQLQEISIDRDFFLHPSRYWMTHSQAVRLCGTKPKRGERPAVLRNASREVVPLDSCEKGARRALLSRTPPFFGVGVGIFTDGKWKQIKRPTNLVVQLNPKAETRKLWVDGETAADMGLNPSKGSTKELVDIPKISLYHASQLEKPNLGRPPRGVAINPGNGRRWPQPVHNALVTAGVLLGHVSPFWLTRPQAEKLFGVKIEYDQNIVRIPMKHGIAVPWAKLDKAARDKVKSMVGLPRESNWTLILEYGNWERADSAKLVKALKDHPVWVSAAMLDHFKMDSAAIISNCRAHCVDLRAATMESFINAQDTSDPIVVQPRDRTFVLVSGRFVSQGFSDELIKAAVSKGFVSPLWFTSSDLVRMGLTLRPKEKPTILSSDTSGTVEHLFNIDDLKGGEDFLDDNPPLDDFDGHQVYLVNWHPVVSPGKRNTLDGLGRKSNLWVSATEIEISDLRVKAGAKPYRVLSGVTGRKSQEGSSRTRTGRAVYNAEQTSDPVRAMALSQFLVRNKSL